MVSLVTVYSNLLRTSSGTASHCAMHRAAQLHNSVQEGDAGLNVTLKSQQSLSNSRSPPHQEAGCGPSIYESSRIPRLGGPKGQHEYAKHQILSQKHAAQQIDCTMEYSTTQHLAAARQQSMGWGPDQAAFLLGGGLPPAKMLYKQKTHKAADSASIMPDGTGAKLAVTRCHIWKATHPEAPAMQTQQRRVGKQLLE